MKVTESNFLMMSLLTEEYHELKMLSESGGVWSYIKRAHLGFDNNLEAELRRDIRLIRTEYDKRDIIFKINHYIAELRRTHNTGIPTGKYIALCLLYGIPLGGAGIGIATGIAASRKIAHNSAIYQEKLIQTIERFEQLKVEASKAKVSGDDGDINVYKGVDAVTRKTKNKMHPDLR